MRISVLLLMCLALAACGGKGNVEAGDGPSEELLKRAEPAERNLERIRDAVVKYYAANKEIPPSVSDLKGFGGGPDDLQANEDYADVGFSFIVESLQFDEQGNLTRGWFFATPKGTSDALKVRMNGVTGTFDYSPKGERWKPAAEDKGWAPGEDPPKEQSPTIG